MLVKAMSGLHVVMAHISSPTLPLYLICIFVANSCCSVGSVEPIAALNFSIQVVSVGNGGGRFLLMGKLLSQVARFVDVGMAINFDVDSGLAYVDAIEHI